MYGLRLRLTNKHFIVQNTTLIYYRGFALALVYGELYRKIGIQCSCGILMGEKIG